MRLMGTIIVALLAITMAILPISVPQVAMAAAHGHATVVDTGHEHAAVDRNHVHAHVVAASLDTAAINLGGHDGDSHNCPGSVCCNMNTCHAVQASVPPSIYSPTVSQIHIAMSGDEQVGGITGSGLDRPPRTV